MHRFIPQLAEEAAPRYTSYPTAAEFGPAIGGAEQRAAIAGVAPGEAVSLYIHIPYCRDICWYCGCNTGAVGRGDRLPGYIDAVIAEAAQVAAMLRGMVTSVHFGGGSPNALAPADFARLAAELRALFPLAPDAEWAAELDPRGLDEHYAQRLARAGITRASLGVQSFAPHIQARINRIQPLGAIADAVAALRGAGIARVNFDLMYGLPGQRLDDIAATIVRTRAFAPDRVAMFGYAHLPAMLPRQRMIDEAALPDAASRFWQSALAHDLLVESGYRAIGFDHFARADDPLALAAAQGRLRRNFQGFTDERAAVTIGLGASAISQFDHLIVQNEKHVGRYRMLVLNGQAAGVRGVARSADDRMRAAAIERLLCDGAVELADHADPAPLRAMLDAASAQIDRLVRLGICYRAGTRIELTAIGRPYARLVARALDARRAAPVGISRAV